MIALFYELWVGRVSNARTLKPLLNDEKYR